MVARLCFILKVLAVTCCGCTSPSEKPVILIDSLNYSLEERRYINPDTYENMILREKKSALVAEGVKESYRDTVSDNRIIRVFGERNDTIYQLYEIVTEQFNVEEEEL